MKYPKNKYSINWKIVFNIITKGDNFLSFFFIALFLSVLGNSFYDILKGIFLFFGIQNPHWNPILIFFIVFLIFCFIVYYLLKKLEKEEKMMADIKKSAPKPHKGLILLVSRTEPANKAIQHHLDTLEECWFICSHKSLNEVDELKNVFGKIPAIKDSEPIIINDVFDPIEFYNEVKIIYNNLPEGWTKEDIIADITGMTALGSIGTVLACLLCESHLQYTPAQTDENGMQTGKSLPPMELKLVLKRKTK